MVENKFYLNASDFQMLFGGGKEFVSFTAYTGYRYKDNRSVMKQVAKPFEVKFRAQDANALENGIAKALEELKASQL